MRPMRTGNELFQTTVYTLHIQTSKLLTILIVKIKRPFYTSSYVYSCWKMANSIDPDQTPQNAASDQGLHCLLRPVCPNT